MIQSQTANKVSQAMAEAGACRPRVVGDTLNEIARVDSEVLDTVIEVMEIENVLKSNCAVDVIPEGANVLVQLGDAKPRPPRLKKQD